MLSVICNEKLKIKNVKLLGVFVAAFLILNFTFYIQPVRAQACVPPTIQCGGGGVCVEPAMNSGSTCPGSGGRIGTINDCGECTNLNCSGTQRFCNNTCTEIATILTGTCIINGEEGTRDSCGTCVANGPRAATRQYGNYPGTTEAGFIHISGDFGSGGDMYLNSGRAIRVDGDTATNLNVGNYSDAAGAGDTFGLRLHAPDTAIAELLLEQGTSDRWSISLRTPSRNLEIWRNNAGWSSALTINYDTGAVSISGALTVGGATVLTDVTTPAGSGITVTGTGNTRQVAVSGCVAGQVLKRAAGGATWECAEDALGAAGVTDHGLLEAASLLDNDHPQYYRQTGELRNLTIGGDLLSNTLYSRGSGADNIWLGDVNDSIRVLGDLRFGPDATPQCTENQILKRNLGGTAWVCAADGGTTYTAGDYMTIGADNRISATHDAGCFGAIFQQASSDSAIDGDIDGAGANGYQSANAKCPVGEHVCTTNELLQSINCGILVGRGLVAGQQMWISNGAPSLPTPTNDCQGWTDNTVAWQGIVWEYQARGGRFFAERCSATHAFACCR